MYICLGSPSTWWVDYPLRARVFITGNCEDPQQVCDPVKKVCAGAARTCHTSKYLYWLKYVDESLPSSLSYILWYCGLQRKRRGRLLLFDSSPTSLSRFIFRTGLSDSSDTVIPARLGTTLGRHQRQAPQTAISQSFVTVCGFTCSKTFVVFISWF